MFGDNMTKEEFISKIWGYYIMLENNFVSTFQYVEPSDSNNTTYSKEYNKLLLSIGSEIDVVCKEMCKKIESKTHDDVKNYKISDYKRVISNYNNFINETCKYKINTEDLQPWNEWNTKDSPTWWKNYNSLKHDRLLNDNHKLGSYINVRNSLAALYILCRVLYKNNYQLEPTPKSQLFSMNGWKIYNELGGGFVDVIDEHGNLSTSYYK